jgi:hypothetical protein
MRSPAHSGVGFFISNFCKRGGNAAYAPTPIPINPINKIRCMPKFYRHSPPA